MLKPYEYIPYLESVNVATEFSPWIDEQSLTTAKDNTAPSAPTLSAGAADQAIELTLTEPSTDADGTACEDFDYFKVYYKGSSGVTTGDSYVVVRNTQHSFPASSQTYFRAAGVDIWGNEGSLSGEDDATPTSADPTPTDLSDISSANIITDSNISVGNQQIAIVFEPVPNSWIRFSHFKLYYDVDTGGGFTGSWTEIKDPSASSGQISDVGHLFKYDSSGNALSTTDAYKFKVTAVDGDGNESTTGCVADNGGSGFVANQSDNSNIIGTNIFARNITAFNEITGDHIYAGSQIVIGPGGHIRSGQTAYNTGTGWWIGDDSGTIKLSLGDPSGNYVTWDGSNLAIKGSITITGGSGIAALTDAGNIVTADDLDDVTDGSTYKKTTSNEKTGAGRAYSDIDASGNFVGAIDPAHNAPTGGGSGLYLGADYLGFYNGSSWKAYINNSGNFKFEGDGSNYIEWNGSTLTVRGSIDADDISSGILTGRKVRTASSGNRAVLAPSIGGAVHALMIFDGSGNEKIRVTQENVLLKDASGNTKAHLYTTSGYGRLGLGSGSSLYMQLYGDSTPQIVFSGSAKIDASSALEIEADGAMTLDANSTFVLDGASSIKLDSASSWIELEASADILLDAGDDVRLVASDEIDFVFNSGDSLKFQAVSQTGDQTGYNDEDGYITVDDGSGTTKYIQLYND